MIRILALGLLVLTACGPTAVRMSAPPAGKNGQIDSQACLMEVSTGVAIAFECRSGGLCDASSDDSSIAEVRRAFINETEDTRGQPTGRRDAFVLIGKSAGTTTINLAHEDGVTPYSVVVD